MGIKLYLLYDFPNTTNWIFSGPMVYGIAYCPVSKIPDIEALGVADSKQLKESDRDEILGKIHENSEFVGYCVTILSPNYLSTSMLGRENYNLNAISHDTAIALLRNIIAKGVKVRLQNS